MSSHETDLCYFCKKGNFIDRTEDIAFHQWTEKGYVSCRVTVPVGVCDACGAKNWNEQTEALIEAAVRKAYDDLP
jgi:hypothetical protein